MKTNNKLISAISLLLLLTMLLSACNVPKNPETTDTTDALTTEANIPETEDILTPEEIAYEKEVFPEVHITTKNNFQVTSKTEYTDCNIRFVLNDRYSEYTSTYTDEDGGAAQIRCRGNMSYSISDMREKLKYSYKIKLEEKANVLGMSESKHWVLVSGWRDPSYQRNKGAYDFSGMIGLDYVKTQWVTVYYNGNYRGIYLLGETIRLDDERIDIFNWEEFAEDIAEAYALDHGFSLAESEALSDKMENDLKWVTTQSVFFSYNGENRVLDLKDYYNVEDLDLTSGYLIESCTGAMGSETINWYTQKGVPISVDSPSRLTNITMYKYVRDLIQDFEDAIYSPNFHNSKGKHYSEYLDMDSIVDYWMVWNFFLNNEFPSRSLFFYINEGKITWGPCWDFDQTMGSVMTVPHKWAEPDYWLEDKANKWWGQIFRDPWFTSLCQERWFAMRELMDVFEQTFDIYYNYIAEEAERSYAYDGERYVIVNRPEVNNGHSFTPEEDYHFMKDWMERRIQWLDEHYAIIDCNIDDYGNVRSEKIFNEVTYNGKELPADSITVHGVNADYLLPTDATGELVLSMQTTHSGVTYADSYLNGSVSLGKTPLSASTDGEYKINISDLNMENGALNVIYIIAHRADNTVRSISSVYIRVSDMENPTRTQRVVEFGKDKVIVEKNGTVTFPEAPYTREGYVFWGWTTGDKTVYKPGETYTVTKDISFYIRWKPTDMCSQFRLDEYTLIEK